MFKCLKSEFKIVEKKIGRIIRKLEKYAINYKFEILPDTIEEIPVYVEKIDYSTNTTHRIMQGNYPMDIVNYIFEMDELKLGDYSAIALIEHDVTEDHKNIVHVFDKAQEVNPLWDTIKSHCEHCGINRQRIKTVILRDSLGNFKQVGKSCLKEFTGVNGSDIVGIYTDIKEIIHQELSVCSSGGSGYTNQYFHTKKFLATCVDEVTSNGYDKNSTLTKVKKSYFDGKEISEKAIIKTEELISFFKQYNSLDDMLDAFNGNGEFYWSIALNICGEYCKANGLVAYAYDAYLKAREILKKIKRRNDEKAISKWVYNVGDKVQLELTYVRSVSYEADYTGGYRSIKQYIHLFKDKEGNLFKWNTAKRIEAYNGDAITLKGTIKKHSEYEGEKQTELTRCKCM